MSFIWLFIQTFTSLFVFLEGLLEIKPFRKPVFLEWTEIRLVKGGLWSQRLALSNEDRSKKIKLNPNVQYFSFLVDVLRLFRADLWKVDSLMTFYKSRVVILFFLGAGLSFTYWGFHTLIAEQDPIGFLLLFFSSGGYLFFTVLPFKATLQGDSLVLQYFLRKKVIFANQVSDLTFFSQAMPLLPNFAGIHLILKNKKIIDLSWFSMGGPLLYAFLATWLGKAMTPKLEKGVFLLDEPVEIPSIYTSGYKLLSGRTDD